MMQGILQILIVSYLFIGKNFQTFFFTDEGQSFDRNVSKLILNK